MKKYVFVILLFAVQVSRTRTWTAKPPSVLLRRMLFQLSYMYYSLSYIYNTGSGGINIRFISLTFEMSTVHRQNSIHLRTKNGWSQLSVCILYKKYLGQGVTWSLTIGIMLNVLQFGLLEPDISYIFPIHTYRYICLYMTNLWIEDKTCIKPFLRWSCNSDSFEQCSPAWFLGVMWGDSFVIWNWWCIEKYPD